MTKKAFHGVLQNLQEKLDAIHEDTQGLIRKDLLLQ